MGSNPFTKVFKKFKNTLSRSKRNLAEDKENSESHDHELSDEDPIRSHRVERTPSNVSVIKRIEDNRKHYESLAAKGHIYQDVRDCVMKSLYNYVICASIKQTEMTKEDVQKLGNDATLSSTQKSSSLGSDKKSYSPYIMWKFPEEVNYLIILLTILF
jgi:hypothetical protein